MKNSFFSKKLCYFRTCFSEIKSKQNSKFGQYSNLRSLSSKLSFSEIKLKEIAKFGQYSQPIFSLQIRKFEISLGKTKANVEYVCFSIYVSNIAILKNGNQNTCKDQNGVRTTKKSSFRLELRWRWNGSVFPRLELRWTWNGSDFSSNYITQITPWKTGTTKLA